jgi:hypothetical protein
MEIIARDGQGRRMKAAASPAPANLDSLLGALCDGLDDCVRRST